METKLGKTPAYPGINYLGMSERLLIAKDILCAMIRNTPMPVRIEDYQTWNYERISEIVFRATDELLKQENQ